MLPQFLALVISLKVNILVIESQQDRDEDEHTKEFNSVFFCFF